MPGTVKSELLSAADRSHKCDSQEKVCWIWHLPLDKSHFITALKIFLFTIFMKNQETKEENLCLYTDLAKSINF